MDFLLVWRSGRVCAMDRDSLLPVVTGEHCKPAYFCLCNLHLTVLVLQQLLSKHGSPVPTDVAVAKLSFW